MVKHIKSLSNPECLSSTPNSRVIESILEKVSTPRRIYIAYSGGIDSHVLLHLCASMPSIQHKIISVHIHHGLQTAADEWPGHCRLIAEQLGVGFVDLYVDARAVGRVSPEEAARNARYDALKALLDENDVLMVAQHREDQLETVLLQLFRGAGLQGLSGMPEIMPFGKGVLLRPLLSVAKRSLEQYATRHDLNWIEDPSNKSSDYDRNFLRNEIVPLLKQRWPSVDKTVSRSAVHCAEASSLLGKLADDDFKQAYDPDDATLSIGALLKLDSTEQALVVRQWFSCLGLKMPSRAFVCRVLDLIASGREAVLLPNQGHTIRRYRDKLYCLRDLTDRLPQEVSWSNKDRPLELPGDSMLQVSVGEAGIDPAIWKPAKVVIKFRSGGEKIALPNRAGRHGLKNLYQEAGIPPWERPLIPLIYIDGRFAAVADLWIGSEFYCENKPGCIRLIRSRKNKNRKGHDENAAVD